MLGRNIYTLGVAKVSQSVKFHQNILFNTMFQYRENGGTHVFLAQVSQQPSGSPREMQLKTRRHALLPPRSSSAK